ncbi:MAG: thioredoxin fold domain-containing protein [Polaromonas sp.]
MTRPFLRSGAIRRRHFLAAAGGAVTFMARGALAAPARLPLSISLAEELRQALAQGQPLVVMVSLEGCPFCKVVSQNFLGPMQQQEGLPVVQVDMRSPRALRDFTGAAATHDHMTRTWGIKVAPTVLFFGRNGVEVAERMVGGYLPDFYAAYLDERLQQARRVLRAA